MRIGDLVRHKDDIVFENDVQLDWYPSDPRNRGLVGGYMFTRNAPPGKRSSIQMLEDLRAAIEHGKPNRFVAIANYGRGKTHFALALANFFGKPADSEEVRLLLRNIEHVTDRGVAQHFREFKERRPPFLVLRIRGDDVAPLYQQVMRGLEKAVRELTGNAAERLPLWFDSALSFLERLAPEQVTQANQFLATRYPEAADYSPLTYEMLSTWVRERRPDAYEPCRELFACFHGGTYPDFGGLVGIKEALASVIERYCRGDQPQAGGVLVLFDELSVFIQRNAGPQGGRLQDLLDGVRDHPHHAVCIAFAQHDPNVVVSWTLRNPEDPARQRIEKELDRFDKASRHSLHSTLETVLDAHLQPNSEEAFSTFYRRHLPAFDRAQDMTLELFADRYAPPDWSCDTFEKVVTKGCFPLHPLTTALFADMEIGEIATTRNVLGLLRKEIETFAQMEAVVDGRPNWIYPIAMVDWFREALGNEHYRAYLAANEKVGADATQVQKDLLKALLLCAAASALSKSPRFDTLMEHLTGHPRSECIEHLKRLNRAGYIQYDDHRKVYRLWPAGADPAKLDRELAQEVARRSLDRARLDEIARRWRSSGRLPTLEIRDVTWGHLSDWECDQVLATKETLTTGWLRSLATTYGLDSAKGLRDGVRGVLVQIIAETPGELVKHEEAETLLREALDCDAPPVVLALPMDPSPNIRRLLLEEQVLQDWAGKQEIYGADIYRNATVTKRSAIDDALSRLKKNNILCVHPDHQAQGLGTDETDERFVRRMFKTRYRFAPPAFFTQYKTNSSKLMKATGIVAEALFSGAPEMHQNLIESDPVAKDLYAKYIRRGSPGSWELTSGGHELIEPRGERTLKAWEHLDGVFARGVVRVKVSDGIMPLLNPPYGYDWNTALLLFAAWFGYNRSEITLERKGLPIRIEDIGRFRELL
ncbi:MAG: hypothetical protein GX446_00730, partial [Chthonomonadales bacterium]|nr:hypothetical protein [Chthonomonadales bacterium]